MISLEQEAYDFVMSREGTIPMNWAVTAIVQSHEEPTGEDKDWWLVCAYDAVRSAVRDAFRRMKHMESEVEVDRQLLLPGYTRLQVRYINKTADGQVAIPLVDMTKGQILQKVAEFGAMRLGLSVHIDELLRYLASREAEKPSQDDKD